MNSNVFVIENDFIKRTIEFDNGVPIISTLTNKKNGYEWKTQRTKVISFDGIDMTGAEIEFEDKTIIFKTADHTIRWEFRIFDGLPVVESKIGIKGKPVKVEINNNDSGDGVEAKAVLYGCNDFCEGFGNLSNHIDVNIVELYDVTDNTNYFITENTVPIYHGWGRDKFDGRIFSFKEKLTGEECLVVKNSPCISAHYNKVYPDLITSPTSNMHIACSGIKMDELSEDNYIYSYPVALGVCSKDESVDLFRDYYRQDYKVKTPYIMSNTWGDRNADKCLCEEFILKELEVGAEIGIDILQIDDGWQKGVTSNSQLSSKGCWFSGFRDFDPEFWSIDKKKFPNDFDVIVKAAKEKNIKIGLWFSPDGKDDYASWELDAQVMLDFYHRYDITYFKLDGIKMYNRVAEERVIKMLSKVREGTDGKVIFNMDITNGKRLGYLSHKDFGDLFVENRYTDTGNYYPHNTLRNIWELSKYFPTQRMQMEVLNNRRNAHKYNDVLAPINYDIDYIFASVMVANPLMWHEMSSLDRDCVEKLSKIISVYKKYRDDFVDVKPIFNKPNGMSLTGFKITGKKNNYVVLLREYTDEEVFDINVKEILATNDENAQCAPARLTKKRTYMFAIVD